MTRKPDRPNTDGTPAGTPRKEWEAKDRPPGRRFSGCDEILQLEKEIIADGGELPNRAIPIKYHEEKRDYTTEEINELIDTEVETENPNRKLIGYLNELKRD